MEAAGCCITDEERAVCGDVAEDYVEILKGEIRRSGWDTEEDALLFENSGASGLVIDYGYGGTSVDANCLAGLIRLESSTEGFYRKYYPSRRVEYKVNYVDGKREGKWVRYYKSGKVYEEGNITDEDIWKDGECVEISEGDD